MGERKGLISEEIDLRDVFRILRRRYRMIVLITLAAFLASLVINEFMLTPVYSTNAVMMVTRAVPESAVNRGTNGEGLEGLVNSIATIPPQTMNTYVGQLESNAVMERVIKKLRLDREGYTPGSLTGLINIAPVPETNLINIHVNHTNPFTAQKIANAVSTEFLDYVAESNEKQLTESLEFLEKQAKATAAELDAAIKNLNNLEAEQNGVTILNQLISAKIQELTQVRSQLVQARAEYRQLLAGIDQAGEQLSTTSPTLPVAGGTNLPAAGVTDETGAPVAAGEPNPAYNTLNTMVVQKTVSAAETSARIAELSVLEGQVHSELLDMEVELNQKSNIREAAENEVNRLQETYSLLRSKINEARIAKALTLGETGLTIVSEAPIPGYPVKPNKTLNMTIAVVLGLMISVALALLLNYIDNTIKTAQEAEDILGLPVLGRIPVYKAFKGSRLNTVNVTDNVGRPLDM